jgi:hypothetical protein
MSQRVVSLSTEEQSSSRREQTVVVSGIGNETREWQQEFLQQALPEERGQRGRKLAGLNDFGIARV